MGIFKRLFGKKENVRTRKGSPDVYNLPSEDDRMNWAMEKSRLTLHYFKECLGSPKAGQEHFSIKARIEDNEKVEHIWLTEPSFDGQGNIFGVIGNDPIDVKTVKIDQKIGITADFVSDWMIVENGKLIGGYTIRAIREGLKENELASFDKQLGGMFIDEGEDYFLPNFETPEGAILLLEEAYDENNIDKAISCKNFEKEAELMLKKTLTIEFDQAIIETTAEALRLSFIKSLQEHGMPKFDGVKRAFKRQFLSEEHCIVTEICYYPDGGKSAQKLNTFKANDEWKVLNPED